MTTRRRRTIPSPDGDNITATTERLTDIGQNPTLASGEGEDDVLRQPPRNPREPLLGKAQWWFIAVYGALLTISTLASLLIDKVSVSPS